MDDQEAHLRLTHEFTNPESASYMNFDFPQIARLLNKDARNYPISIDQAQRISRNLSFISKMKERRILRGKKRKDSQRMWISYSPNSIILADLAFIPTVNTTKKKHHILLASTAKTHNNENSSNKKS